MNLFNINECVDSHKNYSNKTLLLDIIILSQLNNLLKQHNISFSIKSELIPSRKTYLHSFSFLKDGNYNVSPILFITSHDYTELGRNYINFEYAFGILLKYSTLLQEDVFSTQNPHDISNFNCSLDWVRDFCELFSLTSHLPYLNKEILNLKLSFSDKDYLKKI